MSDILIKDMEMPRDGSCFQIVIDDDGNIYPTVEKCIMKIGSIATTVPISSHGRLIDADKMEESVKMQFGFLKLMGGEIAKIAETLEKGVLQEIANAPTIIPAEPAEEGE